MMMRDIPRDEWGTFLDGFTREHRNEPVTVAKTDVRDGLLIAERAVPLIAIRDERDAHRIAITVGEPPAGEVTHAVVQPEGVSVEAPAEADEDPEVAVHLRGGGQHFVVRLERARQP
jgi:hypothetical protein